MSCWLTLWFFSQSCERRLYLQYRRAQRAQRARPGHSAAVEVCLSNAQALCCSMPPCSSPPYGFTAARHKQGADVMPGCSIVQIEWVVFCETVRFLGQLSHSLKGSGFFFASSQQNTKCSSLCSSRLILGRLTRSRAIRSTRALKAEEARSGSEGEARAEKRKTAVGRELKVFFAAWYCSWLRRLTSQSCFLFLWFYLELIGVRMYSSSRSFILSFNCILLNHIYMIPCSHCD